MFGRRQRIGFIGEELAARFLSRNGYRLLQKNFRKKRGEIDLVVEKEGCLVFVEVKTMKKDSRFGEPLEKVGCSKLKIIERTARLFLIEKKYPEDQPWQIDVISIELDYKIRRAKLTHLKAIA